MMMRESRFLGSGKLLVMTGFEDCFSNPESALDSGLSPSSSTPRKSRDVSRSKQSTAGHRC